MRMPFMWTIQLLFITLTLLLLLSSGTTAVRGNEEDADAAPPEHFPNDNDASSSQSSQQQPPQKGPRVAVIGGGIAGTFVSHYLAKYDTNCALGTLTLLDAGFPSMAAQKSNPQDAEDEDSDEDEDEDSDASSKSTHKHNTRKLLQHHQGSRVSTYILPQDGTVIEVGASIVYDGNKLVSDMVDGDARLVKTPPMENTPPALSSNAIQAKQRNHRRRRNKGFAIWNGLEILVNTADMPSEGMRQTDYQLLARYNYDLVTLRDMVKQAVTAFHDIYHLLDDVSSSSEHTFFASPDDLWKAVGLYEAAQLSFDTFLDQIGISRRVSVWRKLLGMVTGLRQGLLRDELMTGANLSNYNQDNTELNGLAGLVSFVPSGGELFSIQGGNDQLPASAWKQAIETHHTYCSSSSSSSSSSSNSKSKFNHVAEYASTVVTTGDQFELFTQHGTPLGEYDVVILAAPLQQSRIQFLKQSHFDAAVLSDLPLNGLVGRGDDGDEHEDDNDNDNPGATAFDAHRAPPPLPSSATRQYRQTITTVLSHGALQPDYFGFQKKKQSKEEEYDDDDHAAGDDTGTDSPDNGRYIIPKSIYMTVQGKAATGISSISQIHSKSGTVPGVFKMFSSEPMEVADLTKIFGASVQVEHVQTWGGGPYGGAYPTFDGGAQEASHSLPFLLYDGAENLKGRNVGTTLTLPDGPGLYYVNGMEAAVAAIEISAIGAKAVAKLVAQRLGFLIVAQDPDQTFAEEL
jgi:prenylcysteine oxidase/farnesylcysteine lyase